MKITSVSLLDHVGMTASLPLEDGITTLTGANAAGKTMLASTIPGILFNEAKLASGATMGMTWEGASGPGSMFVSKTGAKTLWRGTINGKAQEHSIIKPARKWLSEHFPVSQAVFANANYLAAFRSGVFLGGMPAARMQALAEIIDLRVFDDLREAISKLAQEANITIAMRKRIQSDLAQMQSEANPLRNSFSLAGMTGPIAERRSDIRSEALELARALEDRPFGNVPTKKLKAALEAAPARNKAWDAWDEVEALNIYDIKKPSAQDYNAAMALKIVLESNPRNKNLLNGKVKPIYDHAGQQAKLAAHAADIDVITKQLEHLVDHEGNNCPTCGSEIDGRKLIKTLRRSLAKLESEYIPLEHTVQIAKASEFIRDTCKQFSVVIRDIMYLVNTDWQDIIDSYQKAQSIEDKFGGELPFKPKKGRIDVTEVTAELKLRAKGYGDLKEGERQYALLSARYAGATGVLSAVTELVEEQSEATINQRRIAALREELEQLPDSDDAELLIELLKALENKNARNRYLELVSDHLIATLNDLAPKFFPYPIEFSWTNGKFLAKRKGAVTDITLLSGREGRVFLLLNAAAIQLCLPPAKRLRTLIIDEIEAGSTPESRNLLAELIPDMLGYYDNILMITPMAKHEFYVSGARYVVTDKKRLERQE